MADAKGRKKNAEAPSLRHAGFFMIRTPHLPFDALRTWSGELRAPRVPLSVSDAVLAEALAADREALRERLRTAIDQPAVREALFVASPSLTQQLGRWLSDPASKESRKVEHVLVRYFSRMSGRCTPFGLFAAFGLGRVHQATSLAVEPGGQRRVRLDMAPLVAVSEALEGNPRVRSVVRFKPNRALYELGGKLLYPELRRVGKRRGYELAAIDPDDALLRVLDAARAGARRDDIAAALVDPPEITLDDARAYVDELIDAHILESELMPPMTGEDPLTSIVKALDAAVEGDGASEMRATLHEVKSRLERLDTDPLGVEPARYQQVADLLTPIAGESAPDRLFQVDMRRKASGTLSEEDMVAITRGVRATRIFDAAQDPRIEDFAKAFSARYDRQEVPLMVALDEELGVGFDSHTSLMVPLIANLPLQRVDASANVRWNDVTRFLFDKLTDALSTGKQTITLTETDLAPFGKRAAPLPDSFNALVSVVGGANESGGPSRIFFKGFFGPSGASFLGRFCAWDPEMTDLVRQHLREEESRRPEAIFAEIVYLPTEPRLGNIVLRPIFRDYEIAFCARPGVDDDHTLLLSDLRVSVDSGRVVLRSARLGKEVIPRMSNAFNAGGDNLRCFTFLVALQKQGVQASGGWSWFPFTNAPFLPRVELGNVILSPRRWSLDRDELQRLTQDSATARFRAAAEIRQARGLPRYVGLADFDNVLPVDLDNALSVDGFAAIVKKRKSAALTELFCEPEDLVVRGEGGSYTNEIVVPLLRTSERTSEQASEAAQPRRDERRPLPSVRRQFAPGSEWLFAKIYCSTAAADTVLRSCVRPMLSCLDEGLADRWFFMRYADPDKHIRLRFHGAPQDLFGRVLPRLQERLSPLLAAGSVNRLELGTYEREIERYGGESTIEICEQIFMADSEAALRVIELLDDDSERAERDAERDRWAWTLLGAHRLFDDFGLDLDERHRQTDAQRRGLLLAHRTNDAGEHRMAARYRTERAFVEQLLAKGDPRVNAVFDARSRAVAPWVRALTARLSEHRPREEEALGALIHMWNNRVISVATRLHELVLHTFLTRHYASAIARRSPRHGSATVQVSSALPMVQEEYRT